MKNYHLCRCCLSRNCFKDIANEYFIDGKREIYSEIIFETFNLHINYQKDSTRLICEDCITQLRHAAEFRNQIVKSEEFLTSELHNKDSNLDIITKTEVKDDFLDHITGVFDDESSGDESGDHQCDGADGLDWQGNTRKPAKKCKRIKTQSSVSQSQLDMQHNSLLLLNNSNLCLFDSLKTKFRCFYCKESYLYIKDLREHAITHSNQKYLKMCIKRMRGLSFKNVDISHLSCKLCSVSLIDLNDLKTHLIEKHNLEFSNEKHLLVPYKLEDGFNCVNCNEQFNTFYRLSIHMNTHYTNNVCEICGVSYINRLSLRMHVSSIHKEKKCSICSAVFQNHYNRVKHMRTVHNTSRSKRYCLLCNKTFRYTYMLNEHKIQEHGAKRQISSCVECGKTFLTPQNLKIHVRSVHIKERNHPCSLCGMRFFTKCDQRRHERTHQDVRSFACSYCEGRFKSKDSLRRHLRRQHGHTFTVDHELNE